MFYATNIPCWDYKTGDYNRPYQTADVLTTGEYGMLHTATEKNPLFLFAIGGNVNDDFSDNWDIYATKSGYLFSIARAGSTAGHSCFGTVDHIYRLMRQGHFSDTLTEYGKKLMNEKGYKV